MGAENISWSISAGEPTQLLMALYIRDVADLAPVTDPIVPPLRPAVTRRASLVEHAEKGVIAEQWAQWWTELLMRATDPRQVGIIDGPNSEVWGLGRWRELQDLVRETFPAASDWADRCQRELGDEMRSLDIVGSEIEGATVDEVISQHPSKRARKFSLRITELPVDTLQGWRISENHIMVTRNFRLSQAEYRRWLQPIITRLAWGQEEE